MTQRLSQRSFPPVFSALCYILFATLFSSSAEAIGDPDLDYHTISTPNFHVHYHDGIEGLARRSAIIAEEAHQVLSPLLDWKPGRPVHMLVTDDRDSANGFARVFGRNFITIYAKPPTPENNLGYFDDWLRVLIYHEYVHILHIDTKTGIPDWYNRVFGKQYHPNSVLPRWYKEGVAIYYESHSTGRGRAHSPIFRMWLRTAALDDEFFTLGQATGLPFEWPSGTGPYLYGAFFIDYLGRTQGENYIRDFNHLYGDRPIPFAMQYITQDITGSSLDDHWQGFVTEAMAEARARQVAVRAAGKTELEILTDGGGRNRYPVIRPGEVPEVTFQRTNLSEHPVYATMPRSGAEPIPIRDADGGRGRAAWSPDGRTMYFARIEPHKNYYSFADIFSYTPETGVLRRLTEADRAREPDISPDGTEMVHVRIRAGSMELVRRPLANPSREEVLLGRNDWAPEEDGHWQQISTPVYTPDGEGVVFSWWRADRRQRDLFLYRFDTGQWQNLTDSPAHDIDPSFGPDGYLYFTSNVDDIFNIHAMDIDTGQVWQVSNVLRGVFHPQVTPDREWIYVYTYTHRGFELARFRHPQRFTRPDGRPTERNAPKIAFPEQNLPGLDDPQPYRPWRWMAPMFFSPDFGVISEGAGLGATVRGYDPVEHHHYTASAGFTTGPDFTDRGLNIGGRYRYTGGVFNVTTTLRMQDLLRSERLFTASQYVPYIERRYRGSLELSYPIRLYDGSFSLGVGYDLTFAQERRRGEYLHEPGDLSPEFPDLGFLNEFSFRLSYSNLNRYAQSISVERGVSGGISTGLQLPQLGHDESSISLNYNLSFFRPNPFVERHVFALRLRGAINRSSTRAHRLYSIGGHSPHDVLTSTIFQDPRGGFPIRGYPIGATRGDQYQVWKLEYRFPLREFDRGFSTTPLFIRNLKGALFVDTGAAFTGHLTHAIQQEFRTGVGAEIQLDTIIGFAQSNSFRLGHARGLNEDGISDWYLFFGGSF